MLAWVHDSMTAARSASSTRSIWMHASVLAERLPVEMTLAPGEVVVADGFVHSRRGSVVTPAAPLLVAELSRRGLAVGSSALAVGALSGGSRGDAVVHAVSYLTRDREAVGFAVAVGGQDAAGAAVVGEVVAAWAAVLRTRRL